MVNILRFIYTVWCYFVFISTMLVAFVYHLVVIILTRGRGVKILYYFYRPWTYTYGLLTGTRYIIEGTEKIKNRSYVITCNHGSTADMFIISAALKMPYRPLGKMELKKIPVMGYIFSRSVVFVNRENAESRRKSVVELKKLIDKNISILILPEGTRNRTPDPLIKFHDGAFRIAIECGIPILPMVIINTRKLFPNHHFLMNPTPLKCIFLDPVPVEGLTDKDVDMLKNKIREQMWNEIVAQDESFEHLRESIPQISR